MFNEEPEAWKNKQRFRRGGKKTQKKCTKKALNDPDNKDSVVPQQEPDFLECELKWALGRSITGDGIPAELFQILEDDAVKSAPLNMLANLENPAVATGVQKVRFHSKPKKCSAKECKNYHTFALISHASKVILKNSSR